MDGRRSYLSGLSPREQTEGVRQWATSLSLFQPLEVATTLRYFILESGTEAWWLPSMVMQNWFELSNNSGSRNKWMMALELRSCPLTIIASNGIICLQGWISFLFKKEEDYLKMKRYWAWIGCCRNCNNTIFVAGKAIDFIQFAISTELGWWY